MVLSSLQRLLSSRFRSKKEVMLKRDLPRSAVAHDSIDDLIYDNLLDDSPRFRKETVERAPRVMPTEEPEPIDITTATPDEIREYQEKARAARKAREEAPTYSAFPDLMRDVFYSYHTHDLPEIRQEVDPDVALHPRIMEKLVAQDDHAHTRDITRDEAIPAAIATMRMAQELEHTLGDELAEHTREQQELSERREEAQDAQGQLDDLRGEAKNLHDAGQPIPSDLRDQIKQAVAGRQQALDGATQIAESPQPMSLDMLQAIRSAAQAGKEAAETAQALPSFGAGMGAGEPTYTSPEQALTIAEKWAQDPDLRAMAALFGRLDRDIRFKRSKRVVGGQDEIVDLQFGDNLRRVLPSELALLSDTDTEDDFYARYSARELLEFSTVGEEHTGRGPILMVLDGSGSMNGERNIWARAVAMCLLHIARSEKRDFALVEFSGGGQLAEWQFKAKAPMTGEDVLNMCSHFFGGGTVPISAMTRALQVMREAPAFAKADVVLVGDGEAGFGPEDENLRAQFHQIGVRIFGIGIAGSFRYIKSYCEPDGYVVDVRDFDLADPSAATAELATHIT